MILEMKRALEDVKSGDKQGYRKIFDATYEDVYCRSLLILQKEEKAMDFMKGFFTEFFGVLDEADDARDLEKWLWQKYYRRIRKQYHKLLAEQQAQAAKVNGAQTLADIPASLPLLHRIMLVMSYKDDFTSGEISEIFGLAEDKVCAELEKLEKILPALTKNQPDSVAGYLANWRVLLLGASRQIISTGSDAWVDQLYREAAADAGVSAQEEKKENFEYFVADVDLSTVKPKKKPVPIVEEEPEEDDEDEYEDEDEDDEDEYDDDEYDEDDEYEEDEDDENDDRYDWDLEDDGRKMMIIGIILALVLVLVIGVGGYKFLTRDKDSDKEAIQTEENEEEGDAELIIKGDAPGEDETETEPEEQLGEEPEEVLEEEPEEPAEPETVVMKVSASSSRVRSEANTDSSVVTSVTSGEQVEVLSDASQEWVQIRCIEQNNEEGYMMSQYLTAVE